MLLILLGLFFFSSEVWCLDFVHALHVSHLEACIHTHIQLFLPHLVTWLYCGIRFPPSVAMATCSVVNNFLSLFVVGNAFIRTPPTHTHPTSKPQPPLPLLSASDSRRWLEELANSAAF